MEKLWHDLKPELKTTGVFLKLKVLAKSNYVLELCLVVMGLTQSSYFFCCKNAKFALTCQQIKKKLIRPPLNRNTTENEKTLR